MCLLTPSPSNINLPVVIFLGVVLCVTVVGFAVVYGTFD